MLNLDLDLLRAFSAQAGWHPPPSFRLQAYQPPLMLTLGEGVPGSEKRESWRTGMWQEGCNAGNRLAIGSRSERSLRVQKLPPAGWRRW
jgi:hypothetical protein